MYLVTQVGWISGRPEDDKSLYDGADRRSLRDDQQPGARF